MTRIAVHWLATLAATIGLLLITGCASSYNSLTNYPNQARLSVWPKNHDTVARTPPCGWR